jgi:hypothetical protein
MSDPRDKRDERELSESEIESARALSDALEGKKEPATDEERDLADLARSLRSAHLPAALDDKEHEAIVSRALSAKGDGKARGGGGRVIRVSFGAAAALALAAAIFLLVTRPKPQGEEVMATFVRSRSTAPLFSAPFKPGDGAARIDRIAMARERDYRENRFTARRTR